MINRADIIKESKTPKVGRLVKVVRGKTARGKSGEVFKIIISKYNRGWKSIDAKKLGIKYSDDKIDVPGPNDTIWNNYADIDWVWRHNVEVVNPEQYQDFTGVENEAST